MGSGLGRSNVPPVDRIRLNHLCEGERRTLSNTIPPAISPSPIRPGDTPALLPISTFKEMFGWYRQNLAGRRIVDPRGCPVSFLDTDFVHLIKLIDKFGKEPKNRRMTIEQIQSGRIVLVAGRFDLRRAMELTWARSIIEEPSMIVPNWQVLGRAIPGDAYIRNFGSLRDPIYRVLISDIQGANDGL